MLDSDLDDDLTLREKWAALQRVARYRPATTAGIIVLSCVAAIFEGIGVSFLVPIVEIAQQGGDADSRIVLLFAAAYGLLGVPFTLEFVLLGVGSVIATRFALSFLADWLGAALRTYYVGYLRSEAFEHALDARVSYFDTRGSDEILNVIVTESKYAGWVIRDVINVVQQLFLTAIYLGIALYLAPTLTVASAVVFGGLLYGIRSALESGSAVGSRVSAANERLQRVVQSGTQGIRDVKLFTMRANVASEFREALTQFIDSTIKLRRNEAAMDNVYQLMAALTVFALIYVALTYASLSLGELGVFLFAMFRVAPRVSMLNTHIYRIEGRLPHLARTQLLTDELRRDVEPQEGAEPPRPVTDVAFEEVTFGYEEEPVLQGVSFEAERGEFVAFVGPSGAGKSTVASLAARLYEPDDGAITAAGRPVDEFDLDAWRSRISVVRQRPYVFNNSLRFNVTLGDPDVTDEAFERACDVAAIDEFAADLPKGYDTVLGDDGVRLSGGQRQRVALARALVRDADVLVLDEATSELDTKLEGRVHRAIEEMGDDRVLLAIAHRLSTVRNADCIHYVEDGRIVESGDHETLLESGGRYASLYDRQLTGGAEPESAVEESDVSAGVDD